LSKYPETPNKRKSQRSNIRKRLLLLDQSELIAVHLCRLRYFGDDQWGFAFYTYSNEKYELSVYPNGQFFGTPEEAFLTSATVYLNE